MSEVSGLDLAAFGTSADEETIKDTAVAQPLLVAAATLAAEQLIDQIGLDKVGMLAGHSVGEIAAAAIAGVLSPTDAALFVGQRGRAMAQAAAVRPTGMSAVIAGNRDEVVARIEELGLSAANNNGAGQIVAAGTMEQLAQLAENPPDRARVIALKVAGAFHTIHMAPAVDHLREVAATLTATNPKVALLSNKDGTIVTSGSDYLDRLVGQVSTPVRWDLCMETMAAHAVTGLLELAPTGTLTGIAKRNLKGVALFNLNHPDQLDEAAAFCAQHAA